MSAGPLQDCRVLDLGILTAGAATAALLADLGAEVIKVESPTYRDPFRDWKAGPHEADSGLRAYFRFTNRNKEGVSIDLKQPQGRAAFLALVAESDIVIENFRRGVLTKLGIDHSALEAVRPGIILASISSQGESGPDANHVSFGTTLEAMSGLAWQTGYGGDAPVSSGRGFNYPDQVVALFAAGMVLAAWRHRKRTGEGAHLDLSQRELTGFLIGEAFGAAQADSLRAGNATPEYALQDCFLASDGRWVAVSIRPDQTPELRQLMACTEVGQEAGTMRAWTSAQPSTEVVAELRRRGIASALVLDGAGVLAEHGKSWQTALEHLDSGVPVKGYPFQFMRSPLSIRRDAPRDAADTEAVLQRLAGYPPDLIETLRRVGAIACGTGTGSGTSG